MFQPAYLLYFSFEKREKKNEGVRYSVLGVWPLSYATSYELQILGVSFNDLGPRLIDKSRDRCHISAMRARKNWQAGEPRLGAQCCVYCIGYHGFLLQPRGK